ncbi:MAG: hypothetical protein WCX20_01625 [Candidatus Shapirobacteria bacterium]|jgi:tRNA G37 N-methylase Trm5
MKKIIGKEFTITSNMKKIPILAWENLTKKEQEIFSDLETEEVKNDNYFRINKNIYNSESFTDGSAPLFEKWVAEKYKNEILENKLIEYLNIGYSIVGAIVIHSYDDQFFDNGYFNIFNFDFSIIKEV